ncbi:MAG: hypothetical protein JWR84_2540 [Caulobacter sp.]|nr:hypothetical protein [Caulobacter sp.]
MADQTPEKLGEDELGTKPEPFDAAFAVFSEWNSTEDEEAYGSL